VAEPESNRISLRAAGFKPTRLRRSPDVSLGRIVRRLEIHRVSSFLLAVVQAITAVLTGAQGAGAPPGSAVASPQAAQVLDPSVGTSYDTGSKDEQRSGTGHRCESEFLDAVGGAEGDIRDRLGGGAAGPGDDRHRDRRRPGRSRCRQGYTLAVAPGAHLGDLPVQRPRTVKGAPVLILGTRRRGRLQ
jgi:hypothetical protein